MAATALTVSYGTEKYELAKIPAESSAIVKACRTSILNNLDLGELLTNLDRASELLFLAYNGVAGFGELVGGVDEIQNKLLKLLNDSQVTMAAIEAASRDVLNTLAGAFVELLDEEEDSAIQLLSGCEAIAAKLEAASARLADDFNNLAEDTVKVLVKTHKERGNQRDKAEALKRQIKEFNDSTSYLEDLKKSLTDAKQTVEGLYNEAKEKQKTEEERAFGLAITESIFGAVGKGLGAFAGMRSASYPSYPPAEPNGTTSSKPKPKSKPTAEPVEEEAVGEVEEDDDDDDALDDDDGETPAKDKYEDED